MSHLLALSVGSVQEFIAAARRTRDLWFGSYLLSEVSGAAAKAVEQRGGRLIFPARSTADSIANKILAEVADPRVTADAAKQAARDCWERFATQVREELDRQPTRVIVPEIWIEQLPDALELFAAWVERTHDYHVDRLRVERLLAGRKLCRDFAPGNGRAGVPKSSLDGRRESVLVDGDRAAWPIPLRLSGGEQLDVIGVTKRLGKNPNVGDPRYPSVARVAAETWLRGVKDKPGFAKLLQACAAVPRLNRVGEPYTYFPYEGTVIFKDRHPDLAQELGEATCGPLKQVAQELGKLGGDPLPYVAVLVADGDGMGAVIANQRTIEGHQRFSQALDRFATEARTIVTDHNGVPVYTGGDDVLAFLPVAECLSCARALHDKFGALLEEYRNEAGRPSTLSVGVAIGQFMEDLEDLLEYARAAEKAAKSVKDKDALAVHLHKRGGSPVLIRGKWSERPDDRLIQDARLIRDEAIPGKLPYELRALADLYAGWRPDTGDGPQRCATAIRSDVLRIIQKKQPRAGQQFMPEIKARLQAIGGVADLREFARELLVARLLAAALRQAKGRRPSAAEEGS